MKKALIIVCVLILVVLGWLIYIAMPKAPSDADKDVPAQEAPKPVTEEDKFKMLEQLSGGASTTAADATMIQKKAELEKLTASSSPSGSQQAGPSEEEKLKILESLSK